MIIKNILIKFIFLIIFLPNAFNQTICEGKKIQPISTFNQCNYNPYVLIFEDDFNGNQLDLSNWELQGWGQGALYGNNGPAQEYNTLDNVLISNGTMKIITKKETVQKRAISWKPDDEILDDGLPNLRPYYYTSSNIWSKYKIKYGKIEARIKIPKGKGFWPAFWTFSGNPWNEIDIFEFWNEKDIWGNFDPNKLSKVHHLNVHYDFDNDGNTNMCESDYTGGDFSNDFHVFTLIWENDKIEWYVDGSLKRVDYKYFTLQGQITGCTISANTIYIMNQIFPKDPMAVIFNLAIQNGNNAPDNTTVFPNQLEIDWIKIYQKQACQNINITSPTQFPINNQLFNTIAGTEVTIKCDFIVNSLEQLNIFAKNSITLNPGFSASCGSKFHAKIQPSICNSFSEDKIFDSVDISRNVDTFLYNTLIYKNNSNSHNIQIFPNPNNGFFIIDLGESNSKFNIQIFNKFGQAIFTYKNICVNNLAINLKGYPEGIYFLNITDIDNSIFFTKKIIIND